MMTYKISSSNDGTLSVLDGSTYETYDEAFAALQTVAGGGNDDGMCDEEIDNGNESAWLSAYVMSACDSALDYMDAKVAGWRSRERADRCSHLPVMGREIECPSEKVECIDCGLCAEEIDYGNESAWLVYMSEEARDLDLDGSRACARIESVTERDE